MCLAVCRTVPLAKTFEATSEATFFRTVAAVAEAEASPRVPRISGSRASIRFCDISLAVFWTNFAANLADTVLKIMAYNCLDNI
jgi:hypothetical protein